MRSDSVPASDMNRSPSQTERLPDEVQALFFAGDCFALGEQQLNEYRMKLNRARADEKISPEERERIRQNLFQGIRKAIQTPVSHATFVSDELVTRLIELYVKVRPRLQSCRISNLDVMWPLAEHVLVPTAHLIIRQRCHLGLGTEFLGERCWYLPESVGRQVRKPVQRVLDCWLRVAGLRTDYRVSKEIGDEAVRRKVNRWLDGKNQPTLAELHGLVDEFSAKVSWLDEPDSWKARFTLACAAHKAWNRVDDVYRAVCPTPALKLAQKFRALFSQPILHDDEGLLVLTDTFFAVCLLQTRLQNAGTFEKIIAPARKERHATFGPDVPDAQIEQWKKQAERDANPGNWFLHFLRNKAVAAGRLRPDNDPMQAQFVLKEYVFDLGIEELNHFLPRENAKAGKRKARQP